MTMLLAETAASRVVNATLDGLVLTALVWTVLRLLRGQNSRTRFAIWFVALIGIAALPFVEGREFASGHSLTHGVVLPGSWALYLLGAWALGAGIALLRLSVGMMQLYSLRRGARLIDAEALPEAIGKRLAEDAGGRRVRLAESEEITSPAVIGFFRPAVVLPGSLVPQLSEEELDVIVLHELAHIRRWDDWSNLAQKLVKAVFFFHPAVWWIESRLTLEREMACDDMVIARTASAKAYASFLISFHEKLQSTRTPALVQALVSRMCQLSARISEIMSSKNRMASHRKPLLAAGAAMAAILFGVVPRVPGVVAFESPRLAKNTAPIAPPEETVKPAEFQPAPLLKNSAAQVVPAAYHPRKRVAAKKSVAVKPKPTPTINPRVIRASSEQPQFPAPPMLVVFRQFDGAAWTICVWSVDPQTNQATQQTFVLKI